MDAERIMAEMRRDLAHFTECQMATAEWLPASTGKHARSRQELITNEMLAACLRHGVTAEDCNAARLPRTAQWLEKQRESGNDR